MSLTVAELRAVFSADTTDLKRGDRELKASASSSARAFEQAGHQIDRSTKRSTGFLRSMRTHLGLIGVTGATFGLGALIKQSSQLEQAYGKTMALMKAATGATGAEMKALDALVMKLGAGTQFSAGQAADAMLELAKAGVSTKDIMGGGLKNTLLLASAGSVDLGTAATIASNAMNTFNLKGKQMRSVAAALAGGANASSASVESLGQGLQQVGPGAKNAGLSLQETVAALSAFDAAGIKGSDAGTSLKTMLVNLIPQTTQAKDAMKDLGLNFINADGSFKSLSNVAGQLHDKLGPLTEAQRSQALTTIFGSDASRAAAVLMDNGTKGIGKYIRATKDQTAAEKMAKAAMSGTAGAMERLSGSVETAQLALGKALAPTIRDVANSLSNKGVPAVTKFITGMQRGTGPGGALADTLIQVRDAGAGAVKVAGNLIGMLNELPGPVKKYGAEALIAYAAVNKLLKIGGKSLSIGGLGKGAAAGALGGGVQKVFVTNPGFTAGGKPGVAPVATTVGASAAGSALGSAGSGVAGGIAGAALGKAAPNLFKIWAAAQEKAAAQGALRSIGKFAGGAIAGMSLGGGMKEIKPGQKSPTGSGSKLVAPGSLTKADLAQLSEAEKRIGGVNEALKATKNAQAGAAGAWKAATGVLNTVNPSLGKYAKVLKTVPKEIRSYVSTPGAALSMGSIRQLTKQYHLTPKQVKTIMQLQGFSETQQRIIAAGRSYQRLPKGVRTALTADTVKSVKDVTALQKRYNLTPAQKKTLMKVSGVEAAIAKARALKAAIDAVHDKNVHLNVIRGSTGTVGTGNAPKAQADGGTVAGARYPYGDKVLTHLAPTEEVTSNRHGQADKFRPELKMINAGASRAQVARMMIARGLADGGTVGTRTEILEAERTIRDLARDLRRKKFIGKGKSRHKVLETTGLDRQILFAQIVDARKELARLKSKPPKEEEDASDLSTFRDQMMGSIFSSGTTSASQLLKNLVTNEVTNDQWAKMLAGLSKAGLSKGLLDQFKKEGPSSQTLALGKSILSTGNISALNQAQSGLGAQGDAYAAFATGKGSTPVAPVHIENFNAQGQTPAEIGERFYFISQVRR